VIKVWNSGRTPKCRLKENTFENAPHVGSINCCVTFGYCALSAKCLPFRSINWGWILTLCIYKANHTHVFVWSLDHSVCILTHASTESRSPLNRTHSFWVLSFFCVLSSLLGQLLLVVCCVFALFFSVVFCVFALFSQ
jgi:hypothetical protein